MQQIEFLNLSRAIGGDFDIFGNEKLQCAIMPALPAVDHKFTFFGNANLQRIDIRKLSTVGGYFKIIKVVHFFLYLVEPINYHPHSRPYSTF